MLFSNSSMSKRISECYFKSRNLSIIIRMQRVLFFLFDEYELLKLSNVWMDKWQSQGQAAAGIHLKIASSSSSANTLNPAMALIVIYGFNCWI